MFIKGMIGLALAAALAGTAHAQSKSDLVKRGDYLVNGC